MRAALAIVVVLGATARADVRTRADELFEKAGTDFKAGRYQDAIKGFREAYDLARDPIYLFNLAQAYRKIFDCVAAAEHYQRFLGEAKDVDATTRTNIEQWIAELRPCVEQRTKETEAARRYEEQDRQRRADEARRQQRDDATRGRGTRRLGLAIGATGGALLVGGGLFALRAQRIGNELREKCPTGCDWPEAYEERERTAQRSDLYAVIGASVGTAAVITGIVVYLRGRRAPERVTVTPTTNGAAVSLRF